MNAISSSLRYNHHHHHHYRRYAFCFKLRDLNSLLDLVSSLIFMLLNRSPIYLNGIIVRSSSSSSSSLSSLSSLRLKDWSHHHYYHHNNDSSISVLVFIIISVFSTLLCFLLIEDLYELYRHPLRWLKHDFEDHQSCH